MKKAFVLALAMLVTSVIAASAQGSQTKAARYEASFNCKKTITLPFVTPITGGAGFLGAEQISWAKYAVKTLAPALGVLATDPTNPRTVYISMRVMAYLGTLTFLIAALGAWFYRRRTLERHRWFLWTAIVNISFPFLAAIGGWMLTEYGRQPWIVFGLLETAKANSPSVSTTWLGISLGVFVLLFVILLAVDIWLMRRYAERDPLAGPAVSEGATEPATVPAY